MIVDCHTHLGNDKGINLRVADLLKSMDKAGIDKSFVFAGINHYSTDEMLKEIKPHRDRLYGVAAWDFNRPDVYQEDKLMDLYRVGAIVAVKFYVGYYHYYPHQITLLSYMNRVGCPAIFHCGDCLNTQHCAKLKYAHPLNIDEVAVDYPDMNFIIAHLGNPWWRDTAEVVFKNKNVYTDVSGFVYGDFLEKDKKLFAKAITEYLEIVGDGDRLLFGTDCPISNQQSYVDCLNNYIGNGLTPEYLTNNVIRAFKL